MDYKAEYERVNWENYSSTRTPVNAANLNNMDSAIEKMDKAIEELSQGGGGNSDYSDLENKPSINNVELSGDLSASDLGLLATDSISDWAKASTKPTYTASEVGAMPSNTKIPTVKYTQITTEGTHIGDITIDGTTTEIYAPTSGGGEGGTSDYSELSNKPSINNVTLSGNKTLADLGIEIPTSLSELSDDARHRLVTDSEKSTWNNKASSSSVSTLSSKVTTLQSSYDSLSSDVSDLSDIVGSANSLLEGV